MNIEDRQPDSTSKLRYKAEKIICQRIIPSLADPTGLSAEKSAK